MGLDNLNELTKDGNCGDYHDILSPDDNRWYDVNEWDSIIVGNESTGYRFDVEDDDDLSEVFNGTLFSTKDHSNQPDGLNYAADLRFGFWFPGGKSPNMDDESVQKVIDMYLSGVSDPNPINGGHIWVVCNSD